MKITKITEDKPVSIRHEGECYRKKIKQKRSGSIFYLGSLPAKAAKRRSE